MFLRGLHEAQDWGSAGPTNPPVAFCSHLLNRYLFLHKLFLFNCLFFFGC